MLCSVVNNQPMEEFMNLNAYKTGFSVCDYIRANLISLNSFHKTEMEKKDINQILSWSLSNHSYKTAVAVLYNDIQNKLYRRYNLSDGKYKGIYELLIDQKLVDAKIMIIPVYESRINIIFKGLLNKNAEDYSSNEITENFDYWIRMLQKLAYTNRILDELEEELKQGEYHSFKQIDDYQLTTKKSFIIELFEGINSLDEGWDSNTLAKELQKYSNIDSVLIRCLKLDSKKLANRYLEAFVYSSYNEGTNKKADNEIRNNFRLPQMSMKEVVSEISGCGRYIIDRYEREHRDDLNLNITIPPIIDLEDRENSKFGETLNYLNDTDDITVGKLFEYNIMIPVIQRDYCMGARITGENDFLAFLLNGFNKSDKIKASTVLLSVALEENEKTIYIFDGQQRTFTLYNILKYCGESDLKQYKFVGRDINNENEYGSPYSKESVEQLYKVLKNNKIDKKGFAEYIKNNVSLKVNENVPASATLTPADAGNLTYTSSNSSIAIVENGKIKGIKEGKANITVSFAENEMYYAAKNKTIEVTVTLNDASVAAEDITLDIGANATIAATTTPEGLEVDYTPDKSGVVTVEDGVVTGVKVGTAKVTLTVGGDGVYAENSTTITVTVKKIDTTILAEESLELTIGSNDTVLVVIEPISANLNANFAVDTTKRDLTILYKFNNLWYFCT